MKRIIAVLAATIILSLSGCLAAFGLFEQDDRTAKNGVTEISVTQPTENQNDENTYIHTDKQTPLKDVSLPDIPEQDITLPNIPELEQNPEQDIKTEIEIPQPTNAETKEDEDNIEKLLLFRLNDDGTEYGVKVVDRHITEIVIPQFYNGLPVTEILDNGFSNSNELEKVTFSGIKRIGRNAFINCRVLSEITDLSTVKRIGRNAFTNCLNLDRIILPISLVELSERLFLNCSTTVFIRKTEEEMNELNPSWSEGRDKTARTVYIGADIPSGNEAELDKTMYFDPICNGTEYEIHKRALDDGIETLIIPQTYMGKPVTVIGSSGFNNLAELTEVYIPDSIIEIKMNAFIWDKKIKRITGMQNVKRIGRGAFGWCVELEEITLPESIKQIDSAAFGRCEKMESIIIPSGITSIADSMFTYCVNLKNIYLPSGLNNIGKLAFRGCVALESIVLPKGVTHIGDSAFIFCSSLKNIVFSSSLTHIDERAFFLCEALESIIFPTSLKYIGNSAFAYCVSLKRVILPSGIEYISEYAFSHSGFSL